MVYKRLIARLDIKGASVIKGIQLEGLRVLGDAHAFARRYYEARADELVLIDAVASLYEKKAMVEVLKGITQDCFIPITVGGGIRSLSDVDALFDAGADKVALNTAALADPTLLERIAIKYGGQAVTLHVEAKREGANAWRCFTQSGRERSSYLVHDWIVEASNHGIGEVLLTSIDRDGTKLGPDFDLIRYARASTDLPLVASSGFRSAADAARAYIEAGADGVAFASALHYDRHSLEELRVETKDLGVKLR